MSEKDLRVDSDYEDHGLPILIEPAEQDRVIFLYGHIQEDNIMAAIAAIFSFIKKDRKKPIEIIISSYGGSVHEMFGLYDVITYAKSIGVPMHTIGLGKVMSAGILLLCAGTKGCRVVGEHTRLMCHGGSSYSEGTIANIQNELNENKVLEELGNKRIAENSNITMRQLEKICDDNSDTYWGPEEAIKLGVVDKILGQESKPTKNAKSKRRKS